MIIHHSISELQKIVKQVRAQGNIIALVPTMGNLHKGHIKLVEAARSRCDFVITTIFVNPLQFGDNEDFDAYPRTLDQDIEKLITAGCHCLFTPERDAIYPTAIEAQTIIHVPKLGVDHCGASRPGHFDGVSTVVAMLFNIIVADTAFFGLKDYQQLLIIRKMVADLQIPIDITGVAIEREENGLAMSSRNNFLNAEQKERASLLYQCLVQGKEEILAGVNDFSDIQLLAKRKLTEAGIKVDFFTVCNAHTLLPVRRADKELVILGAIFIGHSRLIDNILVTR